MYSIWALDTCGMSSATGLVYKIYRLGFYLAKKGMQITAKVNRYHKKIDCRGTGI